MDRATVSGSLSATPGAAALAADGPRPLAALLLALAAAAALAFLAPPDALRSTLVTAPLVAAALAFVGAWAWRRGAPARLARARPAQYLVLTSLLVAGLARTAPALRYGESLTAGLLAGALFVLLAWRVGDLILALRPALGPRLPARLPAIFALLPWVVYLALVPWSARRAPDGDEPYYLLLTHSIVRDLDTDLANNYAAGDSLAFVGRRLEPQPGDPVGDGGEQFSRHNMTLPLLLAPSYWMAGRWGAQMTMTALAALLAWATLRLAARLFPGLAGESLLAWALLAFTPPLLLYSHQIWVEAPAALAAVLAVERALALADSQRPRTRDWITILVLVGVLPLLKLRFLLIAGPLFLFALVRARTIARRQAAAGVAALALLVAAVLAFNYAVFSQPFKMYSLASLASYSSRLLPWANGAAGLFFDCAFGLLAAAPLWALVAAAWRPLTLRRSRTLLWALVVFVPYFAAILPRREWYGGWSPPFRYGLVLLPFLALLLVPLLRDRHGRGARWLWGSLAAATFTLTLLAVVEPGWTYSFADGRSHLLDGLSRSLARDAARFFPSFVRPRPATWIWPVATLLLVPALWWRGSRRATARRWGAAAGLAAAALLPIVAHSAPSRTIEVEDPQVVKEGGQVHPPTWVVARPRYRGGWRLGNGDRLQAPVNAPPRPARVDIDLLAVAPQATTVTLRVSLGTRPATALELAEGSWQRRTFTVPDWPPDAALGFTVETVPPRSIHSAFVIVDRVGIRGDGS